MRAHPPACPAWCESAEPDHDAWDIIPASVTKTCVRTRPCDLPDKAVEFDVTLERFAGIEDDGQVVVCEPEIRIDSSSALDLATADSLARVIAELVQVASVAEAPAA